MKSKHHFLPAVAAVTIAVLLLFFPHRTRCESAGSEAVLETETLGETGNVDDFFKDVIPNWPGWTRHYWTDKELWGNQGYIIGGPAARMKAEGAIEVGEAESLTAVIEEPGPPGPPVEKLDLEIQREKPDRHRVVKGECLWYIAGYDHIYGNPLQWPLIYKANKFKIKNPDLIYPGQVFIIPRD